MIIKGDELRELIRANVSAMGIDATELARRIGRGPDYIRDFLNGRKHSFPERDLVNICRELNIVIGSGLARAVTNGYEADARPGEGIHLQPVDQVLGARDLPVYAAVEGGPGEMVVITDPIEIVPRPWYMREVKDGFAVLITGDSMEPAFEAGDMAIVNPRLAPMRNKNAIFVSGEERGEFRATIKRLLTWTPTLWRVRQFNEPMDFDLERRQWPRALRVVGKYENG